MNSVEKVKKICKDRKIPISRLERDLGYANGYIGQLRKGVFPDVRLAEIANYLDVSISYLIGEEQNKPASLSESGLSEDEIQFIEWYRNQASDKDKALLRTMRGF